jgi:hypothetical protein
MTEVLFEAANPLLPWPCLLWQLKLLSPTYKTLMGVQMSIYISYLAVIRIKAA